MRDLPSAFRTSGEQVRNVEAHSTVQLTVISDRQERRSFFLGTSDLSWLGVFYDGRVKTVGAIRSNLTREVDSADVILFNQDDVLGLALLSVRESLYGAEIELGRYKADPAGGLVEHEIFFSGIVSSVEVSEEEVKIAVLSEAYAAVSVGADRRVDPACQFRYQDPRTCGVPKVGSPTTCNFLLNHVDGCSGVGRWGTPTNRARFGGMAFSNPDSGITAGEAKSGPPAFQLVKLAGVSQPQEPFIEFPGATIVHDAPNKTLKITPPGSGGHGLKNNLVAVPTQPSVNIPLYHPLKFENDAPNNQTLLKGQGLEIAIRNLVIDFGADPLGVVAADSAFAAAFASGAKISIPAGTYKVTASLTLPVVNETNAFILEGQGKTSLILFEGSGHCFVAPNGSNGSWTLRDFRLVCTNLSNTGDGIHLSADATSAMTRVLIDGVSVWNFGGGSGGWGINADNLQSSVIENCHLRGNYSGHIRLVDPDDVDPVKEPNANVIQNNLLDNSPADDFNIAAIYLFNANATRISGNTIQGNFSGSTGTLHGIYAEHCDGLVIDSQWMEDLCLGGSAVKLKNCRAVSITGYHGSGAYLWDFEFDNVRGVHCSGLTMLNSVPHFVTTGSFDIEVFGSTFDHPENIIQSDTNDHIYIHKSCQYHGNPDNNYREYTGTNSLFTGWGEQHMLNANLIDDETGWTKDATYVSRVATGGPHGLGGYWLFNPGVADGGPILTDILFQSIAMSDSVIPNWWTFSWDTWIEDDGNANDADRHVGIAVFATGTTEFTTIIDNQIFNVYPIGKWFRQCVSVYLPAGTSRVLRWRIDPAQTTKGPKTPKVRFSNFRLAPGRESQPGGHTLLSEERTNILRGVNGLQFAARPSAASPASGYGAIRWTGSDYEGWVGSSWVSLTTGGGSGGATVALDNLAAVAINFSLIPATDGAIDLGSAAKHWRDAYINRLRNTVSMIVDTPLVAPDVDNTTDLGSASKRFKNLFAITASFYGDTAVDATGTSTTTPRIIGITPMPAGTAARVTFGDVFNCFQNSNGGVMVVQSWWGMRLHGGHQGVSGSPAPIGFTAGSAGDPHVSIYGSDVVPGNTLLKLLGAVSMSGIFMQAVNSSNSERFAILENGSYRIQSTQVLTSRQTGWTNFTGTSTRNNGSIATGSATATQVAEALRALIADLITHGVIGA